LTLYKAVKRQLAPNGILRAGINLSNFLLVSGKGPDGTPTGVSPDIARRVANTLEIPLEFITFERPGKLADAVQRNVWDIGNIAFEVQRAQTIDFSDPYVLIEANFLVRENANFQNNSDIDRQGVSIGVSERSAYDLWLSNNFKSAKIVRAPSIQMSHDLFLANKVDVLAGLKPKLLEEVKNHEGIRLVKRPFTAVKQSIGLPKGKQDCVAFVNEVIRNCIREGWLADRLEKHGVAHKLGLPIY
jgi:polar amino acid transport system substrate-binding protein